MILEKKTQLHIHPWWSSWSMMSVCESQDEEISSWVKQVGQELEMISSWANCTVNITVST